MGCFRNRYINKYSVETELGWGFGLNRGERIFILEWIFWCLWFLWKFKIGTIMGEIY